MQLVSESVCVFVFRRRQGRVNTFSSIAPRRAAGSGSPSRAG